MRDFLPVEMLLSGFTRGGICFVCWMERCGEKVVEHVEDEDLRSNVREVGGWICGTDWEWF